MYKLSKGISTFRREGLKSLVASMVQMGYNNYVRPNLPRREYVLMSSVKVGSEKRRYHMGDNIVPWETPYSRYQNRYNSGYKSSNIKLIKRTVFKGNTISIIGGGLGVSTIIGAQSAGPGGKVIVYEGSKSRVNTIKKTLAMNQTPADVSVCHAVVGEAISLEGRPGSYNIISSSEVAECDVLEMDCEGAEKEILDGLQISPDSIIVETHPDKGTSTEYVSEILREQGYTIDKKKDDPVSGSVLLAIK